jgi:hypothetical protein
MDRAMHLEPGGIFGSGFLIGDIEFVEPHFL